jgi:hypothetical protein
VYADEHHAVTICDNVILTYSTSAPNPTFLRHWARAADQLVSKRGTITAVTIIDSTCRPPDDVSRKAIHACISKHSHHIDCFAYVVEGQGLGAAAIRTALALLSLVARYPFPLKVFGSLPEAAPWMLAHAPDALSRQASGLIPAAQMMRNRLGAASAI